MNLKAQILELLEKTPPLSYGQIAERLGASHTYIQNLARLTNRCRHSTRKIPVEDHQRIYRELYLGIPQRDIARRYGCSASAINHLAKRWGVSKHARIQRFESQGHPSSRESCSPDRGPTP